MNPIDPNDPQHDGCETPQGRAEVLTEGGELLVALDRYEGHDKTRNGTPKARFMFRALARLEGHVDMGHGEFDLTRADLVVTDDLPAVGWVDLYLTERSVKKLVAMARAMGYSTPFDPDDPDQLCHMALGRPHVARLKVTEGNKAGRYFHDYDWPLVTASKIESLRGTRDALAAEYLDAFDFERARNKDGAGKRRSASSRPGPAYDEQAPPPSDDDLRF
jgi:hypothetical protein